MWLFAVPMSVWHDFRSVHGDVHASKATALCFDLCSQLCVYHIFFVCLCVHAHVCTWTPLGICVLTGLEDREPQCSHTYWAEKGGMSLGPKASHLLTLYWIASALKSFPWLITQLKPFCESVVFTEMVGICALNNFLYIRNNSHFIPGHPIGPTDAHWPLENSGVKLHLAWTWNATSD